MIQTFHAWLHLLHKNNMNKQKTITIIVKFFWPVAAGIETNIMETYSHLVKKGWKVNLLTTNNTHIDKGVLSTSELVKGIAVTRFNTLKYLFNLDIPWEKTDILALHNFDVFPHMFILMQVLLRRAFGLKTPKIMLTPHGGFNPEWRTFSLVSRLLKRPYHFTLGVLLINSATDAVRAVSEWEKLEMIKAGIKNKKICVISNGVEVEGFKTSKPSPEIRKQVAKWGKYLIQVGRIYPIKNYETTIKSMVYLPKNINYVIVGPLSDVSYKAKLEELISSLGLEKRVIFAGVIRGGDKFHVIKNAVMMVHMAMWESFCNVIHEGMSQGLPIIAADNTALPYLVKDGVNGFCIDTKNEKMVAEKINWILSPKNNASVAKISKNNINFSKNHTWKKTSEGMERLYKYLVQIK